MQKLGLGTVQWGTDYGIANRSGKAGADTVAAILQRARAARVAILDTAAAYGTAEEALGTQQIAGFDLVTKTLPLKGLDTSVSGAAQQVRERFLYSLELLKTDAVYGLLVHHASDLLGPSGDALWRVMSDLRAAGVAKKIGCSVYAPQELELLMARYPIDLVQLPYNVFDQRFETSGALATAKAKAVEVHARSAFLQGLLLMSSAELPPHFDAIRAHHATFAALCQTERLSSLCAALQFSIGCELIDKVIVGCERLEQWEEILDAASGDAALSGSVRSRFAALRLEDQTYTNPGRWPKHG